MEKVALHNLGCKVNSYEMEVMQQSLREKGYHIVSFDEVADVYIVNTCTVTNIADRKSRQMLHRARQLNPDAVVVAVGCYVQTGQEAIKKDAGVDLAIGNNCKKDIVAILEEYLRARRDKLVFEDSAGFEDKAISKNGAEFGSDGLSKDSAVFGAKGSIVAVDINHTYEYEEMQLKHMGEHTRAYVKIQDGCNQFCSYCVIPYARGRVRSRRAEDILQEIRGLVDIGCREVVLTGIHISSYGTDFASEAWENWGDGRSQKQFHGKYPDYTGSSKLIDLAERIHEIQGLERIRLGSLEPRVITEDVARRLSAMPKICPHFHLSLQSGCDATLKRMNRQYTTGEYYTSVEMLRGFFDNPAITTDVIVGFPGETEEEFCQTRAFLEKVCFYEMHIFKYSKREGTVAVSMPGQVPEQVKAQRSSQLLELADRQSIAFRRHYIGKEAEVLLEETREIGGRTFWIGHTKDYVKIALEVSENGCELAVNTLAKVPVKGFLTDEILM